MNKRCIVTGGAGFIGSALVRLLIQETEATVLVVDKLTYAGVPESLKEVGLDPATLVSSNPRLSFLKADASTERMQKFLDGRRYDAIVDFIHMPDREAQGSGQGRR